MSKETELLINAILALCFEVLALYLLWRWFAVPAGLPELSIQNIYGLNMLVNFFTFQYSSVNYYETKADKLKFGMFRANHAINQSIVLIVVGFVVRHLLWSF